MKKNDERQVCPPDTQCMSGFIGTILALVISVLAWVQKLSYIPSFAKQDCPDFCEFTRTIEKLKEITVQAEAMSKSVSPSKNNKKKGEEDCICIQDQVSDDERDNVQLLYGENPKAKQSDSCTKCCQKVVSEIDRISSETQTLPAQLQDGTTQPTEGSLSEKGTQDTKEVKVGIAQSTDVECVCDHTQVSDTSLPDASHKQNKKSYLASKQSRTSEEEIAEVYRTLVSEDTYEAEYDEEDVNYFDMVCSEQYRPCRQDMSPYYQYPLQGRQPQQVRQPTPYPKREPVARKKYVLDGCQKQKANAQDERRITSDFVYTDKTKEDSGFGQRPLLSESTPKNDRRIERNFDPSAIKPGPYSQNPQRPLAMSTPKYERRMESDFNPSAIKPGPYSQNPQQSSAMSTPENERRIESDFDPSAIKPGPYSQNSQQPLAVSTPENERRIASDFDPNATETGPSSQNPQQPLGISTSDNERRIESDFDPTAIELGPYSQNPEQPLAMSTPENKRRIESDFDPSAMKPGLHPQKPQQPLAMSTPENERRIASDFDPNAIKSCSQNSQLLAASTPKSERRFIPKRLRDFSPIEKPRAQTRQVCSTHCDEPCAHKLSDNLVAAQFLKKNPSKQSKAKEKRPDRVETLQNIYGTPAQDKTEDGAVLEQDHEVEGELDFDEETKDETNQ